jgi:hypothetical protein
MPDPKLEPTIPLKPGDIVRLKSSTRCMVIEQLVQQGSMVNVVLINPVDGCLYHETVCIEAVEKAEDDDDD